MREDRCVCCGDQWKDRADDTYSTGAKSRSFMVGMQLTSYHGKKRINLRFCNKHANNHVQVTRFALGNGMLQIRNVVSNVWRNASRLGRVVKR